MTLTALVVDDSIVFRKTVRDALESIGGVKILGVAKDGVDAVQKIRQHRPDFVTLDVEMPGMDGLQVLQKLRDEKLKPSVLMVSSLTQRGAESTTRALALGAFDFILKPSHANPRQNLEDLTRQLKVRVKAIERQHLLPSSRPTANPVRPGLTPKAGVANRAVNRKTLPPEAILIGISTGGPQALRTVIPALPANIPVPIVIVQHMPAMFTASMAQDLDKLSSLHVVEAEDGMSLRPGTAYIAPGGQHLRMVGYPGALRAEVLDDPKYQICKPSVDGLFRSANACIGGKALALIMTGMGDDGRRSCEELRRAGATVWAQDAASCTVYGMPRQIIENNLADEIHPLNQIAPSIVRYCQENARTPVTR